MMNIEDIEENNVNEKEKSISDKLSILKTLLLNTFDKRLLKIENSTKKQLTCISSGISLTKTVCLLCTSIAKRIKPIPATTNKRNTMSYSKSSVSRNTVSSMRISRPKTLLKTLTSSKSVSKLIKTPLRNKSLTMSRSSGHLLKNSCKTPTRTLSKSRSFYNGHNNNNNPNRTFTSHHNNSYYSTTNYNNSISNHKAVRRSKISRTSYDNLKGTINIKGIKKNTLGRHSKINPIDNDNIDDNRKSLSKLVLMESNIQIDSQIQNEDPLLVSQITDFDLNQINSLKDIDDLARNKYKQTINFKMGECCENYFSLFTLFLDFHELINLMLVNKLFAKYVKHQIISILEKNKLQYQTKINEYKNEVCEIPESFTLRVSRGTMKATNLLNGPLNKLFTENMIVPSIDILRIYAAYFQIINNTNAKNFPWNMELFWRNTCDYFMIEHEGQTGKLLEANIKKDIYLSEDNLYFILKIINGNIDKINPRYFSKLCGTTGLFAFLIKDVLDCYGIIGDKEGMNKTHWINQKMIDIIERKIDKIKAIIK